MHHLAKLCACAALVPLAACGDDEPAAPDLPGEPAALVLSADTVRFAALGTAERLTATVSDANGIALGDAAVTWSSTDEAVASVDGSGRVEAVGVGETEVTASAGGASDVATVVVTQSAASVSVSPAVSELHALGDSVRYTATVRDANGRVIEDAAVEWTSEDEGVATVDGGGWVVAQANGTAAVTAAAGEASDDAAVVVEQVVASVEVSPAAITLGLGQSVQLTAAVADANGATVSGAAVIWTASDPAVATVDAGGRVTATGWSADATITAMADGASGTADVHALDQLAFESDRDGDDEIYVMNADGSGQTRLTGNTAFDIGAAWSPDGTKIVFRSFRDGNHEIYVVNADGSGETRLTDDPAVDTDAVWSPDGTMIAFQTGRDGNDEIYVVDAAGGGPATPLTSDPEPEEHPRWSPDGSMIAFVREVDGYEQIFIMNADGSSPTSFSDGSAFENMPAWRPRP